VTSRGEEWHRLIDNTVEALHQELDDMQKKHESLLQIQTEELEEILRKVGEINTTTIKMKKSPNIMEMKRLISSIENQKTPSEITQYSYPIFCEGNIDDNYLKQNFGCIEKTQERRISLKRLKFEDIVNPNGKVLEIPKVMATMDSGFSASDGYNECLYDIAVLNDNRMWMGGASRELKLFDFQGNVHATVPITVKGMYLTVHNKQVMYSGSNTLCRVADDKTIQTMFTTGKWRPLGVTSTASDGLLVCLRKDDQSKVVRFSSTGTVLQEIQYDSQGQPLYQDATYITENVNEDIIVTDWKKNAAIAVDAMGIFRFSYSGEDSKFNVTALTSGPAGHVFVTDRL
jgi:hypothetical protein